MITIKKAIDDLKHTAQFAAGAIRKVNNGTDSKAGQAEEAARRLSAAADLVTKTVGDHILHTNLDAEAALCVWEFMLEVKALPKQPEWAQSMLEMWDSMGTVHMRHIALDLGSSVNAVWQSMTEKERESVIPYDWEFCPAFVANLKFDRALANVDPINIDGMKAAILKGREVDAPESVSTLDTLKMAEDFMSGFEGDEMQQGIDAKLAAIRAAIARIDVGSTLEPAGEASAPQYVMMHKITRWVDQSGLIVEEHAEDAEPDSDSEMLWDVWVRAGEHGQQPEEIEAYGGQFETREAALIYATTLASILDIEVDEY